MKQQTKYTLLLTFVTVILVTSGFVLAKKPPKPPRPGDYPPRLTTFSDNVEDAIISDGNGPYSTEMTVNTSGAPSGFEIETGERTILMDLSQCVSEPCETFFDPDDSGEVSLSIRIHTGGLDVTTMEDGQTQRSGVIFKKQISKWETWEIMPDTDGYEEATIITAHDRDGDGTADYWDVVAPQDVIYKITHCVKEKGPRVCTESGRVRIPFSLTVETDQN